MGDFAGLVPEDEQAVEMVELNPVVGKPTNVLLSSIPEDELAVVDQQDEFTTSIAKAERLGCFSAVNGMNQITNVFDNRLFASIHVDAKGNRSIAFCEQYENGEFSPQMHPPDQNDSREIWRRYMARGLA